MCVKRGRLRVQVALATTPADFRGIRDLWRGCARELGFSSDAAVPGTMQIVARHLETSEIVGFVALTPPNRPKNMKDLDVPCSETTHEMGPVVVAARRRNRGVGTALAHAAARVAQTFGPGQQVEALACGRALVVALTRGFSRASDATHLVGGKEYAHVSGPPPIIEWAGDWALPCDPLLRTPPVTPSIELETLARRMTLPGAALLAGRSPTALAYLAFWSWLTSTSSVLVLGRADDTYLELLHRIGCRVCADRDSGTDFFDLALVCGDRGIAIPRNARRVWIDLTRGDASEDDNEDVPSVDDPDVMTDHRLIACSQFGRHRAILIAHPVNLQTLRDRSPPLALSDFMMAPRSPPPRPPPLPHGSPPSSRAQRRSPLVPAPVLVPSRTHLPPGAAGGYA